ncbi:MAG: trypsin-like peptidase domain-containing protein [Myxococcota bacterium]|nr:trypsin-like peptidase domain-containing protein [Myxococcota bacterium]
MRSRALLNAFGSLLTVLVVLLPLQPGVAGAREALELVQALETTFVEVAETARPSVVMLEVHGSKSNSEGLPPGMERFFPIDGLGSGFIIDSRGTILTNHHVVDGADKINVILFDGRQFPAKVVASDQSSDVAVVRLVAAPSDLPVARLGDSDLLKTGQFALAIGAPLGYDRSVTVGHISALHRAAVGETAPGLIAPGFEELTLQDFIQIDAPINPGNSGGPLVNLRGEVIGVNAAIMAAPGGGLGFSIPINLAKRVAHQLMTTGRVERAWLGVRMTDNNPAQAEAFDLPTSQGALIVELFDGSPASRAKLQEDDVIVLFRGRVIRSSRDLVSAVSTSTLNEALPVTVWRQERGRNVKRELRVTLVARPEDFQSERLADPAPESAPTRGGAEQYLAGTMGIELVLAAGTRRAPLKVAKVAEGSLGAQAGLKPDDVILEVGGRPVVTAEQVITQVKDSDRPFLPLVVERSGERQYLSIERPR